MPYDDSPPPTRRARPLAVAAALAAVSLTAAGCGGEQSDRPDAAPPRPGADGASPSASASASASAPASGKPLPKGPLTGRTVVIDPGHNPGNRDHTREINEQVDMGTGRKECDTTGTSTNDGYAEARFTLDVSHRLRALLEAEGARVRLTHDADRPFGPCVDERARIGNEAKADAVVSVHADGSAVGNRGFHVILPARVKGGGADTTPIVKSSADLGARIAGHFARTTGSAPSNYVGGKTGLDTRDDLGGLNLSTVPKVFVECGNMRDPEDAALLTSESWRQKAAQGMADGVSSYLKG
ncbi:N-acetylmuramoyl-L-alanine amidase [Streptomyces californicus]|uniref:N-acetylmuramoyl-L-alanine amidase n=1 Tax=Streptomyces californicus TaxID=67351 RepID=A0ABD7D1U1_9ACTN|nr:MULTISPECIES: N-acetylmuramoyl-L-alanine amidase [Streptomyces]QRV27388.1 N-acetylmuramoyl-L-alanine amidase [Streptomyces californicus]QRV36941.1 N-acetylmuramoyl-L-alanine amidase [Streptomyces californicus]QRV40786.1 N-acetylmuramoyl-L-alanine amidase [Streptomyces californicus]QRV47549.1 N-acetylmuramoyl-L-alanine amidase [Streptomyces californicus]